MFQNPDRIRELIRLYAANGCTAKQYEELMDYIQSPGHKEIVLQMMEEEYSVKQPGEKLPELDWEYLFTQSVRPQLAVPERRRRIMPHWLRNAAAILLLSLSAGAYFYFSRERSAETIFNTPHADIAPPSASRAVLTLSNGQQIILDSAGNGTLAMLGNARIAKTADGRIVYTATGSPASEEYNTLSVPKGSKVAAMTLADGSKVWLNAGSSMKYPVLFMGNSRKVEITGEAYFEVAKQPGKTFLVTANGATTEVLGTHFNINAYEDEAAAKVTLLEGSVKISKGANSLLLSPNQQAQIQPDGLLKLNKEVGMEAVMAWKNSRFLFEGADIHTVMRQVEKWYDVSVAYKDEIKTSFVADISRDVPVSELLKLLQLTNLVHFTIEGNKITVMK